MTTYNNIARKGSIALIALVMLALPLAPVFAADMGEESYIGYTGGDESYLGYTGGDESYIGYVPNDESYIGYTGGEESYIGYTGGDESYIGYTGGDESYIGYTGGSSMPSFGGSGSGFSMPSFGGSSANNAYRVSQSYPTFPNYPQQPTKTTPSNTTVTTNTCTNNSCNSSYVDNSIVDNSVKVTDSFNTVSTKEKARNYQYQTPVYTQPTCPNYGYNNSYNYGSTYNQYNQGYNNGSNYNQGYNSNCYSAPIAYNTTPYVTLSAMPYTGLDLGPMGEVLYWTFLVLWCLGAAYLVVVKRVQNKLVSFLNGFLFGTASGAAVAHATSAPAHSHAVASAPMVEEGIDPFIASQIAKRS